MGSSSGGHGACGKRREWSDLPEPALFSVCGRLISIADIYAFCFTCKPWRSVVSAAGRNAMASLPPLLYRQDENDYYSPSDDGLYRKRDLSALLGEGRRKAKVVNCSLGHLITTDGGRHIFAEDPLTGRCVRRFPGNTRYFYNFELSCHPASPDCTLWASDGRSLEYCPPGDEGWTSCPLPENGELGRISELAISGGKVYVLDTRGTLATFEVDASPHPKVTVYQSIISHSSQKHRIRVCIQKYAYAWASPTVTSWRSRLFTSGMPSSMGFWFTGSICRSASGSGWKAWGITRCSSTTVEIRFQTGRPDGEAVRTASTFTATSRIDCVFST